MGGRRAAGVPWAQTATGRAVDLVGTSPMSIDFIHDIAEQLAKIVRFNGGTPGVFYSVAQHCVTGADYLYRAYGNKDLSAHFLLHDAHEAFIGDITAPAQDYLTLCIAKAAHAMRASSRISADAAAALARDAAEMGFTLAKNNLDGAIYRAAGLPLPREAARISIKGESGITEVSVSQVVSLIDMRLLRTERDHLMVRPPRPWGVVEGYEPLRLRGRLVPQPWWEAADAYRQACRLYLPCFNRTSQ